MKLVTLALGVATVAGPSAYAEAQHGTLLVTSGVAVTRSGVEMLGAWNDTSRPCRARRRLAVRAEIVRNPSGRGFRRVVLSKTFSGPNCVQGGPTLGFAPTAHLLNFACPNGAWKPGEYRFETATTDTATKLKATATLSWVQTTRC